jgi:peptide/nickel transport system substrate-binding protein
MTTAARVAIMLVVLVSLVGCGSPGSSSRPGPSSAQDGAQPPPQAAKKSLEIALSDEIASLSTGLGLVGGNALPTRYFHEFVNAFLTTRDHSDTVVPWLAERLPSLDDGTWQVNDDGTMTARWTLRKGVMWHDGRELTAEDVAFAWEAAVDPVTQFGIRGAARLIERVETLDSHTFVMHWRQTSALGAELGERELDVLPRHLLEPALRADRDNFANHPYFVAPETFIGSGAYRPVEWSRGSHVTVEAFDGYFLGRPKIDRVTFRFINDPRTALANVLAGQVDVSYQAVPFEEARIVEQEWRRSGGGTVRNAPNNFRHTLPQLRAEYAQPADLLNPNVRKALLHAMNRVEIAEVVGLGPELVANSIAVPGTAIGDAVERAIPKYPYDLTRAAQLFEGAGWRRESDGMLVKGAERFRLEYRTGTGDGETIFPVVQQQMRQAGVDLFMRLTINLPLDESAQQPGTSFTGLPVNQASFGNRWHTRQIAAPANRWVSNNRHGYSNPAADRAIEAFENALRPDDQLRWWGESWRVIMEDVAVFPLFFYPNPYIVKQGITGPLPTAPTGSSSFNVHLWDRAAGS